MTQQLLERLETGDKAKPLYFSYDSFPSLPEYHPNIVYIPGDTSSNLWRGYLGTWGIYNGNLFLMNLEYNQSLIKEEPILADWVTGRFEIVLE